MSAQFGEYAVHAEYWWIERFSPADVESMLTLLKQYWSDVADVFREAWAFPPRKSRLMHGVGILSLGYFMDALWHRSVRYGIELDDGFAQDLWMIAPACWWTDGIWEFADGT